MDRPAAWRAIDIRLSRLGFELGAASDGFGGSWARQTDVDRTPHGLPVPPSPSPRRTARSLDSLPPVLVWETTHFGVGYSHASLRVSPLEVKGLPPRDSVGRSAALSYRSSRGKPSGDRGVSSPGMTGGAGRAGRVRFMPGFALPSESTTLSFPHQLEFKSAKPGVDRARRARPAPRAAPTPNSESPNQSSPPAAQH